LQEVIKRERYEEFHKHAFLGRIIAMALGVDVKMLARAEETLELAIFQTAYDPRAIRKQMERAREVALTERAERMRDARMLESVSRLSEYDELSSVDAFKVDLKRTKLSGVEDPWEQ
jgi:hypothetical protein